jgi:hypothetical protein
MSADNDDRDQSVVGKVVLYAAAAAILLGSVVVSLMYL